MASATAKVNSLLICQCLVNRVLKSFPAAIAGTFAPASNDTASRPVSIDFIGLFSFDARIRSGLEKRGEFYIEPTVVAPALQAIATHECLYHRPTRRILRPPAEPYFS